MAKAKVPEDAFYTNPFGIDEGDDVEMNDQNHDMFCSFTYLRARFTCTTAGDGTFMYQWFPMFSKYGMRSSVGPTNVWNDGDMPWSATVQNNFSHYRILGAAMKVIPIASSDNTQGQALGGMYWSQPYGPTVNQEYPVSYQNTDQLTGVTYTAIQHLRDMRGVVEGSAASGLQVNYRHLRGFNFYSQPVVQPDNGAAPAGGLQGWNMWSFDPHDYWPTNMDGRAWTYTSTGTGTTTQTFMVDFFPSLCVAGTGFPASTNAAIIECVLGICGVARFGSTPSRTPLTTFLGSSLVEDNMSNMPARQAALRKALSERAEARGAKLWKALDVTSTVMRSLAPLGLMVNPAIGGALTGASVAASAASTTVRNFYSS